MHTIIISIGLLLLSMIGALTAHSKHLPLDIGELSPTATKTITILPQTIEGFVLINRFAQKNYSIEVTHEIELIEPVNLDESFTTSSEELCAKLNEAMKSVSDYALEEGAKESELAKKLKNLRKELEKSSCAEEEVLSEAKLMLENSRHEYAFPKEVEYDERITVKVTQGDKVWTFIFKTPKQGKWLVSYGFAFISNAQGQSTYHLRSNSDAAGGYLITKDRGAQVLDLTMIPMINLNYLLFAEHSNAWAPSFTGGLGFDTENLAASFGIGGLYRQLIGVNASVLFSKRYRLKSEYSNGQVVQESLDFDQLHTSSYYPYLSLGLSFRLSSNPFERGAEAVE